MNELFRTTLRLYKEKAADLEAAEHLRRAHDEQHLSYTEAIVTAVNAYYGNQQPNSQCFDDNQRAEIRTIIRDELVAMSASINGLLLAVGQQPMMQPQAKNYEPDDADLDDIIDSLGS